VEVDDPMIKRFLPFAALLLTMPLASCTPPVGEVQQPVTKTDTPRIVVEASVTFTPLATDTPESLWPAAQITATPINVDTKSKDALNRLFARLYSTTACQEDLLAGPLAPLPAQTFVSPTPEFIEVHPQSDPYLYMHYFSEIADNVDGRYQAFVACENNEHCYPKIFMKDSAIGGVYEINWEGRESWRDIQAIIWISHDVVAFFQSNSPQVAQVLAVDVNKKVFIYYSLIDYDCPLPTQTP
jgi:hypothetical protein